MSGESLHSEKLVGTLGVVESPDNQGESQGLAVGNAGGRKPRGKGNGRQRRKGGQQLSARRRRGVCLWYGSSNRPGVEAQDMPTERRTA
jgi:hypothetical protein